MSLEHRLLTPLLSKKVPPIPKDDSERTKYPLRSTFLLNRILFSWLLPLMKVGYKRTLDPMDLYYLDENMEIDTTYDLFQKNLKLILKDNTSDEYPKLAILKALFLTFKWDYSLGILYKICSDVSSVLLPLLSKALINFVEERTLDPTIPVGKGIGYSFGVVGMLFFNGICINHCLHKSLTTGAHCKSILTTALLKKSFAVDPVTKNEFPAGKVTSLMSTDLARIDLAIGFQPFLLTVPIPVAIAIALLIVNIGVASLAGVAVFVLAILVISSLMKRLMLMRRSANNFTDSRISLMREILQNMKIIKFYSWEDAYENEIIDRRTKETKIIFKIQSIRNILLACSVTLPLFISMISFLVLYAISDNKSPGDIFSSLSLFSVLANQALMLPIALATGVDAFVGLNRVRQYLQSGDKNQVAYGNNKIQDDGDDDDNNDNDDENDDEQDQKLDKDIAIEVNNASFEWDQFNEVKLESSDSEEINELQEKTVFKGFNDISFKIKKNEFVIITGPIGSGKSSLLLALSGFMKKLNGTVKFSSKPLLCSQPPWIQNATVKENILFGEDLDEEWYNRVIDACSLNDDINNFPAGDSTEIGERGITLSGGQKARISLARSIYSRSETILFDDVLSAVDARVGKHIVESCFLDLLKNQTRILATHQLSLINNADRVIFLNGDSTINIGTVDELLNKNDEFVKLMEFSKNSKDKDDKNNSREEEEIKQELIEVKDNANGTLIDVEEKAKNQIAWNIYKSYMKEGQGIFGRFAIPLCLFLLTCDIFCSIFTNVWLSFWISYKFENRSNGFYIGIYVMFTMLAIFMVSAEFIIIGYITNISARRLNLKALKRILHTPMSFLDTTPMGRILNRFSKDTDALDNETGEQIRLFLHPFAYVLGTLILCICYLPWFALVIPPLFIIVISCANYYQASSREVKRIEAVQRSLVYNNFNEILNGMLTIKIFNSRERFLIKNSRLINKMNEAYFILIANQRWISVHLDLIASSLALIITLLSVNRVFNINAASVGLIVTNVLQIAGLMSLILRAYTQVENEMNSVERLCHYANDLVQEEPYRIQEAKPDESWPLNGEIKFENVSMRYREELPLVLKNLTVSIKKNEKIGICGRTGAGKSTIMIALYRLSELSSGKITIDDVDISKIGLFDLRSKLSIIPQDPVLFLGTIRKNLDPFGQATDSELWDSLRRSGLIENVHKVKNEEGELHKFHLDQFVEDEGANFSLGERQLLALARALVRNSKILILDEATSSVDYETDSKIQKTIINEFSDCTILCIAHRLKTILNYDKILVLDKGELVEFDKPLKLFNNEKSLFRQMCDKSSITEGDFPS